MNGGVCPKNFPKFFQDETLVNVDGSPRYKRTKNGAPTETGGKTIDNSWVVPYNPNFSLKYNCHINNESCASVKCVKYLFKYVYNGHDCPNIAIKEHETLHDEIKSFMDTWYITTPEAAWQIFGFNMRHQTHTIVRLQVQLKRLLFKKGRSNCKD